MWHEARKHERHIRSVLVDYRKRAERRLNFYSQIRQDPIKFLRVYGAPAKINLDIEIRKAAENPKNMMPWVGDPSIIIDRFDARANLETYSFSKNSDVKLTTEEKIEERLCNYERYRCLAHNDFLGVTESMALKQIEREEKYGDALTKKHDSDSKDKKPTESKAAIGFIYEEGEIVPGKMPMPSQSRYADAGGSDSDPSEVDSDIDIDVELDLDALEAEQRQELIDCSHAYGMKRSDFIRLLDADQVLEAELRAAKIQEEEKLQHFRRPRRRHRARQQFDKYAPTVQGPKVGLLNGQPITRRKIYLSGASSDSESYGSPSSEEEPDYRRRRSVRETGDELSRTQPSLYDSKRPAILIGGLTLAAFCDPQKRRRRFRDRPGRRQRISRSSKISRSSSSDASSASSRSRYRRGRNPKRSKVEYITTFGDDDNSNDEQLERREFPLSHIPGMSAGRPGDAASKVAASVISSMFKSSANSQSKAPPAKSQVSTSSSSRRRRSSSSRSKSSRNVERDRHYRQRRRSSSSSSSLKKRQRRRRSSTSSRSISAVVKRIRDRSPSGERKVEPVPIKRYYRRELESDKEERISTGSSTESDTGSRDRPTSTSSFADPNGCRRYHDNQGDTGEYSSGGKRTASSSSNRYSNSANPHSTSTKDPRGKPLSSSSGPSKLTPQEIMKRRMQAQLNKTMNAEKKAESERLEQQERERMAREEGLRKQAAQMRQREIEKRLAERGFRNQFSAYRHHSSSSSPSRSCSPTSPAPALRRGSPSLSVNLEISPGAPSRARLRRSPSPFRRREYQNRYGSKGPRK